MLEHGAIDMIVHRNDMRDTLARLLAKLTDQAPPAEDFIAEPEEVEESAAPENSEGDD